MARLIEQLPRLWARYTEFMRPQLNPNTIKRDYNRIAKVLRKIPQYVLTEIDLRDWLLSKYSAETTRRTLQRLDACCRWAVKSKLIKINLFTDMAKDIRKVAHNRRESFSRADRDTIIAAFLTEAPYFHPFVYFLFHTGCRIEEACGLVWENVAPDLSFLEFRQAISETGLVTPIKTDEIREFPCNRLVHILQAQATITNRQGFVFPSQEGVHIHGSNFLSRQWSPIIHQLVTDRQIYRHLPTKNTRHTFITLALKSGKLDVQQVAALVGNSPSTIYKHYYTPEIPNILPDF